MKITKISYSVSRKIQVSQYEPIDIYYGAEAEIEKDDVNEAYDKLARIVNERIGAEEVKWKNPQMAIRALQALGKNELARQIKKKKEEVPF